MKTIKKRLRRAFTIVELVIVIAVIAALAAILIPTFVNVVNSANEASDVSMLYNINLALTAESATTDIETPEQALDIAAEQGYNIEKLTPSSEGYIVYDEKTTSFALISTDNEVVYPTSNSDLADRLEAATTWYFASSQDEITSKTASYIITGTWDNVEYAGTGSIDTSRATISSGVAVGTGLASTASANNAKNVVSNKVKTSGESTKTVILNINCSFFYIYPSANVNYVIYSDALYYYDTTVECTITTAKGTAKICTELTYTKYTDDNTPYGVTVAGVVVSAIYQENSSGDSTEAITLELGTENYPYLITGSESDGKMMLKTADFTNKLTDTNWMNSTATVYFKLENDVYVNSYVKFNNSSSCGINIDCGGHTIYIVAGKYISFPNSDCNNKLLNIENGTFTGVAKSSYIKLDTANATSGLQVKSSMDSVTISDCIFNQIGIDIGETSELKYTENILLDNCEFNYTLNTNAAALIDFGYANNTNIVITDCDFAVEADYTLYFVKIENNISVKLSGNTWVCSKLDMVYNTNGTTLPSNNGYDKDGNFDESSLQSSTTAFIAAAKGYISNYSQYIELNDDGTNTYTVKGRTTRSDDTTLITNNVNAWGIIIGD